PDALSLLQRLRRLAVPGEVQAALGHLRRRLLRAIPLGAVRLRLAADDGRYPGPPPGLPGPVGLRHPDAVQLQPADQAGRLLPPRRLARGPQPSARGAGLLQRLAPAFALGRGQAGRGAARAAAPGLRLDFLLLFGLLSRPDAGGVGPAPLAELGRAGAACRG